MDWTKKLVFALLRCQHDDRKSARPDDTYSTRQIAPGRTCGFSLLVLRVSGVSTGCRKGIEDTVWPICQIHKFAKKLCRQGNIRPIQAQRSNTEGPHGGQIILVCDFTKCHSAVADEVYNTGSHQAGRLHRLLSMHGRCKASAHTVYRIHEYVCWGVLYLSGKFSKRARL